MTFTELEASVPSFWDLVFTFFTSAHIILPTFISALFLFVMLTTEGEMKFKEFWFDVANVVSTSIIIILIYLASFTFLTLIESSKWQNNEYKQYISSIENKIMDEERVLETGVVTQSNRIDIVYIDDEGNRVHAKADVKYDTTAEEAVLTYKQLEQDVKYRRNKVVGKKGEIVEYTLTLPLPVKSE